MTKLESIEHKIFASEAPLDEIGQFGSALDTTKLNTKDVTTIQALPAYTKGWGSAVISDSNYPTMEEMNGVLNVMSYHTGYLYQEGIPVWRNDREYSATSIVKEPTGTKLFHSLKDGNIGNALDNADYWEEVKLGGVHIIDTYINGSSGYRIWSDGYCEQWGLSSQVKYRTVTTVNLLKTFVNTNYNVSCNVRALEVEDYGSVGASAQPYTTSSIQIYHNKYGKQRDCDWIVCGYLAEGEY